MSVTQVQTRGITNDAVTTAKIDDGAVTTAKIAADAVTNAKIDDDAVTTAKIDNFAVTTGKIAADAVTNAKIAADAVGTTEIANDAVTNAKIAAGAVGTTEIANDAVTAAKLSSTGSNGNPPVYGVRAWGRMINGTTSPELAYGGNVASIGKSGSENNSEYRVNFTYDMPNAQYAVFLTIDSGNDHVCEVIERDAGYFRFQAFDPGVGNEDRTQQPSVFFSVVC